MNFHKLNKLTKKRTFKVVVIILLFLLALRLKGEPVTVATLGARIADLLAELNVETVVRRSEEVLH